MAFVCIKPRNVVHQMIEGEVVAINMETGCYYSLESTAAFIWTKLATPTTAHDIAAELTQWYPSAREQIVPDVEKFVAQLSQEGLVVADAPAGPSSPPPEVPHPPEYRAPQLSKFDDMRELLLLDPIHDMDEPGWPFRPPAK